MLIFNALNCFCNNWHRPSVITSESSKGNTMTYIIIYTAFLLTFGALELSDTLNH